MTLTAAQRFWSKVDQNGPLHPQLGTRCWIWTAATNQYGYGSFWGYGKSVPAHRFIFEEEVRSIPADMEIDHRCHRHECVNPSHMRLTTHGQNMQNRPGAQSNSNSGVRGVWCDPRYVNKWRAVVRVNGIRVFSERFATREEAESAVIEARKGIFTHNDIDRAAA